jgi:hypothetical protein
MGLKSGKSFNFTCFLALNIHFWLLLGTVSGYAQISGCTDPQAANYNPKATVNNGSCIYEDTIIAPNSSIDLPEILQETSGLLFWDTELITNNDSDDTKLYAINPETGEITQEFDLKGTKNTDWEEITQDENFIFIGDFGNNLSGNRKDLKILRVTKSSLLANKPEIDTINFSYEDQIDFSAKPSNQTDYDCEAFFATGDSLYLVTKQWVSQQSAVYTLPKTAGTYKALLKTNLNVQGLTTGATLLPDKRLLVLSGYSTSLEPFIYLVYDYKNLDFNNANKRKLRLELPFTQAEGISKKDGLEYYLSNEYFSKPPFVNSPQRLHRFNLDAYLSDYLDSIPLKLNPVEKATGFSLYPLPTTGLISIDNLPLGSSFHYRIIGLNGELLKMGTLSAANEKIDISLFLSGIYFLKIDSQKEALKIVKR